MDILKAAALFEKLAQQVVNLPQQVILPDQPVMGSAVSEKQVENAVAYLINGFANAYNDPNMRYLLSVVLQPNNAFSIDVRVSSDMVEPRQLATEVKRNLERNLKDSWKNSVFNVSVAPMA